MAPPDRLAAILDQFRVRTRLFHAGALCGRTEFPAEPGRGFLHVLRHGEMDVVADVGSRQQHQRITEPSVIFCPRPIEHAFINAPSGDSDFACAVLDIDGGATHPLLDALPAVLVLPLATVGDLEAALSLLLAEIDNVRCGNRILADRLFEVVLIRLFRWLLDHTDQLSLTTGLLSGLADPRLAAALTAMHEAPGQPWPLTAMAQRAGMSRSAFAAHFRACVGETPAAYLARWRITCAQAQLRAGASVARTATDLGYATPAAFSRAFSNQVGRSPRAWLKQCSPA